MFIMENPVRVLVTGASGLLGRAIMKTLKERNFSPVGLGFSRVGEDLRKCDLRVVGQFEALVDEIKPHVVIHSAAERLPDRVENNFDEAKILNVDVSERLASVSEKAGSRFIFISTDYVFDGKNPPYGPDDATNPVNKYGQTKVLAEKGVLQNHPTACILRIPILYGEVEYLEESGVTTLLHDLKKKIPKSLDHKQKKYPASTKDLAEIICDLIGHMQKGQDIKGVYQWSGKECLTKYDMATRIANIFGLSHEHLLADLEPSSTIRPYDCRLSNKRLEDLGISRSTSFDLAVKEVLQKYL